MDPTSALTELRDMVRTDREGHQVDTGRMLDLVDALDQWLTCGGHLPAQWAVVSR